MREQLYAALLPACLLLFSAACRDRTATLPAAEAPLTASLTNAAASAIGYELQPQESAIQWKAGYVVGGGGHEGTLKLAKGNLAADGSGNWVGGYFVIDMNSLANTDVKEAGERKSLEDHLKDKDFFDVMMFPQAYFTLTKAVPGAGSNTFTITGKLQIKGIIQDVSFPATLTTTGDTLKANATLKIDRTRWGVNYRSGSVFANLKDGVIADQLPITLQLVFKKMS